MTKRRFAGRLAFAAVMVALAAPSALALEAEPAPKPGRLINAGDVLSGELTAMKLRGARKGKKVATYQITSEPRRLPPPTDFATSRPVRKPSSSSPRAAPEPRS